MALELDEKEADGGETELTVEQLADYYGQSVKTIRRRIEAGEITKLRSEGNRHFFKPPSDYNPARKPAAGEGLGMALIASELTKALQDSRRHNEALLGLLTGPILKFTDQIGQQQGAAFVHIQSLQEQVIESGTVIQRMLSEEHDRKLRTLEAEAKSRRLDAALDMAKQALPTILDGLAMKSVNLTKLKAADKVISALPLDALEQLLSAEGEDSIIPPEVRPDAMILLEELRKDAAKKSSAPPAGGAVADVTPVGSASSEVTDAND